MTDRWKNGWLCGPEHNVNHSSQRCGSSKGVKRLGCNPSAEQVVFFVQDGP